MQFYNSRRGRTLARPNSRTKGDGSMSTAEAAERAQLRGLNTKATAIRDAERARAEEIRATGSPTTAWPA
jgi:hypothetical protein